MIDKFPFRQRGTLWLFAAIFCIYMLSMSRERPWGDATPLWEVADNIAHQGTIAIKTRWPATLPLGRGGKVYGVAPILQAAIHIPGAVLQAWRTDISRSKRSSPGASPATWRPPFWGP